MENNIPKVARIEDIYSAKELVAYYQTLKAGGDPHYQFLGESLFPSLKQRGMQLSWIKGGNSLPVALSPASLDTKASIRDRIAVKSVQTEMPFFKESMVFTEKERQDLGDQLRLNGNNPLYLASLMQKPYAQYANLVAGADVQAERMRMSLLSSGSILIVSNNNSGANVYQEYVFDSDGSWKAGNTVAITGTSAWTATNKATSDPIGDLETAIEKHRVDNGVITSKLLMNSVTFRAISQSESVRKAIKPAGGHILNSAVLEYIKDATNAEVVLYDNIFKDENGKNAKYYPDGHISLLPAHSLGFTNYGTSPSEYDLLNGDSKSDASIAIHGEGVAVLTLSHKNPVQIETIVEQLVLPSFEGMSSVYVINCF